MIVGQYGNNSSKGAPLLSTVASDCVAFANHPRNLLLVFNAAIEVQIFKKKFL